MVDGGGTLLDRVRGASPQERVGILDFLVEWERTRKERAGAALSLLLELNERNARRQSADMILNRVRPLISPKLSSGTLIMGMACAEGVVLASDRKIVRGGETTYGDKIFKLDLDGPVLFAAEGLTGVRDDFLLVLQQEIHRRRGVGSLYEVKVLVEDIIATLTGRYSSRVGDTNPIGVLMAGLDRLSTGDATLYYIHAPGYGETVRFRCSGHGGPYAYSLAKFLCEAEGSDTLAIREAALRAAFLIAWVSDRLDSTVGGGAQVLILKDNVPEAEPLSTEDFNRMKQHVQSVQDSLPTALGLASPALPFQGATDAVQVQ